MRTKEMTAHPNIRQSIYQHIYENKITSRQNIARQLHISLPTVTTNLTQLTEMGLIDYVGEFESSGGRKANMIGLVDTARFAIGVDVTREYYSIVLVDLNLEIKDCRSFPIPYADSPDYYQMLTKNIQAVLSDNRIADDCFLGVGISLPALINTPDHVVYYPEKVGIAADFYTRFSEYAAFPFEIFNDANSAGHAEAWTDPSSSSIVYLSLSNSVGGAILFNRSLLVGDYFRSGEFGHVNIVPHGRKCYCGKNGCLDTYCSAKQLTQFTNGSLREFFTQLENGNDGFRSFFSSYLEYLAIAVNNLSMCFDCDIVIGGNVAVYLERYLDELKTLVNRLSPYETTAEHIRICRFQTEPSAAGAALHFIQEFIEKV